MSEWQHHLQQVDRDNALFDVLGFYLDGAEGDIGDTSKISHENARRGVARMDTCYPAKDAQLLRMGCDYLTATGFLSLPNFDPRHT
ncbi:MAG: hypothetical protein GAK32_00406 [Pseudomonas fluorescens]|nr:MAG: hypothetical protein GAK32_00406 [Pseudomonas fluorescens]